MSLLLKNLPVLPIMQNLSKLMTLPNCSCKSPNLLPAAQCADDPLEWLLIRPKTGSLAVTSQIDFSIEQLPVQQGEDVLDFMFTYSLLTIISY